MKGSRAVRVGCQRPCSSRSPASATSSGSSNILRGFIAAAHHGIGPSILTALDAVSPPVGLAAALGLAIAYLRSIWKTLVLALLLGPGVQVLPSRSAVRHVFAGRGARARAAGAAAPAMMCTCCAAPITVELIHSEAKTAAVLAFRLANPVVKPATLVFVGLVMGWGWAGLRLALGVPLVFGFSYLAARILPAEGRLPPPPVDPVSGAARAAGPARVVGMALMRLSVQLVPEYVLLVSVLDAARRWLFGR